MAKISKLPDDLLLLCIGSNDADASDGVLFSTANKVSLSKSQRTLVIGLGGCGIKTVNRVKAIIAAKYNDYQGTVGFLAIDTDKTDMDKQTALKPGETLVIGTDPGIDTRHNVVSMRKPFTKEWIREDFFEPGLSSDGASQNRQACRAKLFDEGMATNPNDARIVQAIKDCAKPILQKFDRLTMRFNVIVILGVAGGTGSGGVNEIAHFVRRAVAVPHKITGYFMMPDVVEQFHEGKASIGQIRANGYAALKEADYYHSVRQRTATDYFKMSDYSIPPYAVNIHAPLYDMMFLVNGSGAAPSVNPNKTALDTTAEAIINQLAESENANKTALIAAGQDDQVYLFSSFLSNKGRARAGVLTSLLYDPDGREKPGICGEDVFDYSAIGVSAAVIPEETVKCYAIEKILSVVSGKPSAFAPANFTGFATLPLTKTAAGTQIANLIKQRPKTVENKIWELCNGAAAWPEGFTEPEQKDILSNSVSMYQSMLNVDRKLDGAITEIEQYLEREYQNYQKQLRVFLTAYGPRAYAEVFEGIDRDGNYTPCIRSELDMFAAYSPSDVRTFSIAGAQAALNEAYESVKAPILGGIVKRRAAWAECYRAFEATRMANKLAEHVFGTGGAYKTRYIEPIRRQSDACKEFAFVLDKLFAVYDNLGIAFSDHERFVDAAAKENAANMNIIAAESDYDWAKQIVDSTIARLNYTTIKEQLIASFMENPKAWTEYDEKDPAATPRRRLDAIMAPYVDFGDDLTIVSFIRYKLATGANMQQTVDGLVRDLLIVSQPLYHARVDMEGYVNANMYRYLVVPQQLFIVDGGAAIKSCFDNACQANNVAIFPSAVSDRLVCYTQATALPLYAQADLQTWQNAYDVPGVRKMIHSNESGKGIYDPETGLAWEDYPALVLQQDPRLPDPATGKVSREGMFFINKVDPLFEEALREGVIEESTDADGRYSYACYCLDKPGWKYALDLDAYTAKDADGYYRKGAPLFAYLAEQNGGTVADIRQPITLMQQGQFNDPYANRAIAISRAKRALRRDVPQYIAVKKTLAVLKELTGVLDAANEEARKQMIATKLPFFIACGNLVKDDKGWWCMKDFPAFGQLTKICLMKGAAMIDCKAYQAGLPYQALSEYFFQKMGNHPEILSYYKERWDMMVNGQINATELYDCMQEFREEAKKFMEQYTGDGKLVARRDLMAKLGADEAGFEKVQKNYGQYQYVDEMISGML